MKKCHAVKLTSRCVPFPSLGNLALLVEEPVTEGDLTAAPSTITGRHDAAFVGAPPTGNRVEFDPMNVFRLANGRVVEVWVLWDASGVMSQMGMALEQSPE